MKYFLISFFFLSAHFVYGQEQELYVFCQNTIVLSATDYDIAATNFRVEAKGAKLEKATEKSHYFIVPHSSKVVVNIFDKDRLVTTIPYRIRRIPRPQLIVRMDGKPINPAEAIRWNDYNGGVELDFQADEKLREKAPNDSRYRVTRYVITLARDKTAIASKISYQPYCELGALYRQAQPGDRFVIEVKEVKRLDFRDKLRSVGCTTGYHIFTILLK